jgi:hypothetical protein
MNIDQYAYAGLARSLPRRAAASHEGWGNSDLIYQRLEER